MDHSHNATVRSSDRNTVISKSLNVAAMNPAVNEQYSKLIDAIEEKVEADRTKVNPLKMQEIANMINQQDALQKLFVKHSLRPLEQHLNKPVKERQRLAKQRIMEAAKHMPEIKMQSSPSRDGLSLMSSMNGASTIFNRDSQMLGVTYSKSVLGGDVSHSQPTEFSAVGYRPKALINEASAVSFGIAGQNSSELAGNENDAYLRKINRIESIKSLVNSELNSKNQNTPQKQSAVDDAKMKQQVLLHMASSKSIIKTVHESSTSRKSSMVDQSIMFD